MTATKPVVRIAAEPYTYKGMSYGMVIEVATGVALSALPLWNADSKVYKKAQNDRNRKGALAEFNKGSNDG